MQNTDKLKNIKLFVLDMDGTIYLGDRVFAEAFEFLEYARKKQIRCVFFTNNASKDSQSYYKKLKRLGFSVDIGDIMTAGDVTIDYLKNIYPEKSVYLIGTPILEESFRKNGINLTNDTNSAADIVVSSFDTSLTYEKLEHGCNYIRNGAKYICTHPDFNCPTEEGFIPDSGAIAALITASTGVVPIFLGKPNSQTVVAIENRYHFKRDEIAIVGDRLYTDIALGKNNGLLSVLVLTGEAKTADINEDNAPHIILPNIGAIIDYI